jgi:hypothetical protein
MGCPKARSAREELELQLALGPTLSATRGWSSREAERAYRRAEELAQGLGAERERFDAVWGLWMIHNTGNAPEKARGITTKLFRLLIAWTMQHCVWKRIMPPGLAPTRWGTTLPQDLLLGIGTWA